MRISLKKLFKDKKIVNNNGNWPTAQKIEKIYTKIPVLTLSKTLIWFEEVNKITSLYRFDEKGDLLNKPIITCTYQERDILKFELELPIKIIKKDDYYDYTKDDLIQKIKRLEGEIEEKDAHIRLQKNFHRMKY